jgi:hypothetical protein
MARLTLLFAAAILSAATAAPVLAQTAIRGTADAMASVPLPPSKRGNETSTLPWSAPVGHRQPRVDEVPVSERLTQEALEQEDARVDRKINNICRGC